MEVLRALALSRGWVVGSGLPDETRAGRRILKDYVDGKLLACRAPPGASAEIQGVVRVLAEGGLAAALGQTKEPAPAASAAAAPAAGEAQEAAEASRAAASGAEGPATDLDDADLGLLDDLREQGS